MTFWGNREKARQKQIAAGRSDQGECTTVTAGNNMDGFVALVIEIGARKWVGSCADSSGAVRIDPTGLLSSNKAMGLLVIHEGRLIAAVELKSQVGPSFGNNFNNRMEEAIGTAHDFWTAYRESAIRQRSTSIRRMGDGRSDDGESHRLGHRWDLYLSRSTR